MASYDTPPNSPDDEIETVAAALARVTGKRVDKCRQILIAASTRPSFQATDLLLKLSPSAAWDLTIMLRHESPKAFNWLIAGCRTPSTKRRVQRK